MSTGEIILVLLAMVLFMTVAIIINNHRVEMTKSSVEIQLTNDAISLAQSIIEEAWSKGFDEDTSSPNGSFTSQTNFGKESGESYPHFDDIDDFVDYPSTVSFGADELLVDVSVTYVDNDGISTGGTKSQKKKLQVVVTDSNYNVNISLYHIFSFIQ